MMTEDYVSFEIAKLLKEKGFSEWCRQCYGVAVLHNGVDISFDEECELKDEGRKNEIEYVEGGRLYDYGCNNSDKDAKVWAAPTLWVAIKWLRKIHNIYIDVLLLDHDYEGDYGYVIENTTTRDYLATSKNNSYNTPEEAYEVAIKYCLENLI